MLFMPNGDQDACRRYLTTFKVRQGDPGDTVAEQGTLGAMRFAPLLQDVWQLTKKVLAMLAGLFLISLAGLAVFAVYSGVTSLVGMLL